MTNPSTSYLPVYRNFELSESELKLQLSNTYVQIAQSVNSRQTGFFTDQELQNGQQWYLQLKPAFRKILTFGAITPGGPAVAVDHNIQSLTEVVNYWGVATTASDWRQLPYASVTATSNIELRVTATQAIITAGATSPAITSAIVVLNYLKS